MVFERQGHWTESRIVIRDLRDFFSVHVMICMWSYSRKSQPQMLNGKFPLSALCRVVAESEASQPVSPGLWLVCSYGCSVLIGCLQHCRARTADSLGCNWPVTTTRRRTPGPECANHKSVHEPGQTQTCTVLESDQGEISHMSLAHNHHMRSSGVSVISSDTCTVSIHSRVRPHSRVLRVSGQTEFRREWVRSSHVIMSCTHKTKNNLSI